MRFYTKLSEEVAHVLKTTQKKSIKRRKNHEISNSDIRLWLSLGFGSFLLVTPLSSNAEEDASTLSGRVIDMEGNPVSDLTLGIQPIDIIDGEMWQMPTPMQQSRTNSTGAFASAASFRAREIGGGSKNRNL